MQIAQQISFLNRACEYSSVDYSKETERKELKLEKEVWFVVVICINLFSYSISLILLLVISVIL